MMGRTRVVPHDMYLLTVDYIAAKVLLEFHRALEGHAESVGFIVRGKEFFRRIHLIDILPTTAVVRFEERGKSNVAENAFPVERVFQVTHGLGACTRRMLLVR